MLCHTAPSPRARRGLAEFFRLEAAGGIVLIAAAVLAMVAANSPLVSYYEGFRALPVQVRVGALDIGNEFLVEASKDGQSWSTVLKEEREIRDQSNRGWRDLDLDALRGSGHTVPLRFSDSFPADGWGAWLARTRLVMER